MGLRPETERWIAVIAFGFLAVAQIPILQNSIVGFMKTTMFSNLTIANGFGILGLIEAIRMVHNGGHF